MQTRRPFAHLLRIASSIAELSLFAAACLLPAQSLPAQSAATPPTAHMAAHLAAEPHSFDRGSVGLWQTLHKLRTRASLLLVTAHPDDEDGPMLTYESRHGGARATLLSLTRGEAGQNVLSADTWDALGLMRTQEMLSADSYYGVHAAWATVADFGFTKTKAEALSKWGHQRVLCDTVRIVRQTRPLVIASVFASNVSDGHGQHQVAGQMAQEAYTAAGDPSVCPDQIRAGLRPWSPQKLYIRVPFARITDQGVYDYATGHWAPAIFHNFVTGAEIHGQPSADVSIPTGQYDPLLGLTYFQLARLGLGQQRSQNDGLGLPLAQPVDSGYHLYAARVTAQAGDATLFSGIDTSLTGIATLAPAAEQAALRQQLHTIQSSVDQAIASYSAAHPERTAPSLADGLRATNVLIAQLAAAPDAVAPNAAALQDVLFELRIKQRQFSLALAQALGLSLRAMVVPGGDDAANKIPAYFRGYANTFRAATPGQRFSVQVHLSSGSPQSVQVVNVALRVPAQEHWSLHTDTPPAPALANGTATDAFFTVQVPQDAHSTQAYFHRASMEQPVYSVDDPQLAGRSFAPYPLHAVATLRYSGVDFSVEQTVATVGQQRGLGPVFDPLLVAPALSVALTPRVAILPIGQKTLRLTATVTSNAQQPVHGSLRLLLPAGWTSDPATAAFALPKAGGSDSAVFTVTPRHAAAQTYTLQAEAASNGQTYRSGYRSVGYPGLRPYPLYRDAATQVHAARVRVAPGLRIGYIAGTGDALPESLAQLGIPVQTLTLDDLAHTDLTHLDAILLGIRAYSSHPDLAEASARLLAYVHQGGVLLVTYNTAALNASDAPYPLSLGSSPEKVIDEDSAVQLLHPQDVLLNWPNHITEKDFSGWVEERGHGFLSVWDSAYTPLLEMHDPDQTPQQGGLIYARYGKGLYIYTALALDRQMPEGVPGAYRIFANLISAAKNPKLQRAPK
jgi:LmbE family N-acetylglucosaminyl deacetylase